MKISFLVTTATFGFCMFLMNLLLVQLDDEQYQRILEEAGYPEQLINNLKHMT